MTFPLILTIFSTKNVEYLVMTDSSYTGVGVCLMQRQIGENDWKLVRYVNTRHLIRVKPLPMYYQKLFAINYALSKYYEYLIGGTFTLMTDTSALKVIPTAKITRKKSAIYGVYILIFLSIVQIPGKKYSLSDLMSRFPLPLNPETEK